MTLSLSRSEFIEQWDRSQRHEREAFIAKIRPTRGMTVFSTPGQLAMALDPTTIQTPMFDLIDSKLLLVRDAIQVAHDRKLLRARLIQNGMEPWKAIERAQKEIEDRGIKRLNISVPPQEGKSTRVSRYFPMWLLQQFPTLRGNLISYDLDNASQFTSAMLADITTFDGEEGQLDLGLRLRWGQRAQSYFALTTGGSFRARGKMGGVTGRPGEIAILDDLIKDQADADSEVNKAKLWTWIQTVLFPRQAPDAPIINLMTRWAIDDPTGMFLKQQEELEAAGNKDYIPWVTVNVPAKAEENDLLGRKPGEWLLSARGRTATQWRGIEVTTDPKYFDSLYQGSPTTLGGDIFLDEWKREYDHALWRYDAELNCYMIDGWDLDQSWDFTFRDKRSSDFVAGGLWATQGSVSRLVTVVKKRMSFTDSVDALRRLKRLFPQTRAIYVEGKANGDAIIDSVTKEVEGIIRVDPRQSKPERARLTTPYFRAGNIEIPTKRVANLERDIAFDVEDYWHEMTTFREGVAHDDQVDMTTQFISESRRGGMAYIEIPDERVPTGPATAIGNPSSAPRSSIIADRIAAARGSR